MRIDRHSLLFFDAACLIAAAGSPSGGSGFLLYLCQRGLLRGAVSPIVLWEAETNITAKLPPSVIAGFHRLVALTPFVIAPPPSPAEIRHFQALVNPKDAHVAAAAIAAKAPYLLSLDRPFLREVEAAPIAIQGFTPGAFITTVLPTHPDAARLRE
jgi:predicted nucleic acid-binding protein